MPPKNSIRIEICQGFSNNIVRRAYWLFGPRHNRRFKGIPIQPEQQSQQEYYVFKGLGNLASLMRNAQDISGKFGDVSEELKGKRATGSAGGGMISVEVNGLGQVLKVHIDSQLLENNEHDMIQDLLPAAINEASSRARQMHVDAMKELTGGLSLPGMDDMIEKYTSVDHPDTPGQ